MKKGFYITRKRKKFILEPTDFIGIPNKDIIELVIPDGVKTIYCYNNNLTKLIIPNSVETIYCYNNNLTELIIPDSVKRVDCHNNNLTKLIVPDSDIWIDCCGNQLTELIIPDDCEVYCDPDCKVITRTMYNRSKRLKAILK